MKLQLVKDYKHGYVCILGSPTTVTDEWLALQRIPFEADAEFVSAYPIDGGAVVIDATRMERLGEPSWDQLQEVLGAGKHPFNPAADTIIEMLRA